MFTTPYQKNSGLTTLIANATLKKRKKSARAVESSANEKAVTLVLLPQKKRSGLALAEKKLHSLTYAPKSVKRSIELTPHP